MNRFLSIALVSLLAIPAAAQRGKIDINAETPEGQLLQQIGTADDAAKKLALLEEFAAKYPKHEGLGWVYGQLQPVYLKAQQYDKVFPVTEKLLQADPSDSEMAHGALKAAEAKKDPDLVMKWASATSDAARLAMASKKPAEEDEVEAWTHKVDFAKQVETYTEYSLFSTALQTSDPAKKILLIDKLAERNPKSQYLSQLEEQKFIAYRQLNNNEKALEMAEATIAKNPGNEDMLLFAADQYLNVKKDNAKALLYADQVVELMKTKPAPNGVSAPDWEKKKQTILGLGLWMSGMIQSSQSKFSPADKTLREALPYLAGNDQLLGPALFHLGLANYRIGSGKTTDTQRILDALKFNTQCAAIKGPFQTQAQKNIAAIRAQFRIK
ncbi:MAG: hypothetical protein JJE04_01450 [Acidobacteriia bacterium]|nr:hypothetical protein [Terriglobia bacterium]